MTILGTCDEEVTRKGELQPCEKLAVAIKIDVDEHLYPVCSYHARGTLVPLDHLLGGAWQQGHTLSCGHACQTYEGLGNPCVNPYIIEVP